jgi:hypothetical protein
MLHTEIQKIQKEVQRGERDFVDKLICASAANHIP